MIVRIPSNSYQREIEEGKVDMRAERDEKVIEKKSYWVHVCEAFPLVCKSLKLKMIDHLLLGGEHARKISPGFSSPIKDDGEVTVDEKKEIVKASPSFGMFSLFKYHLKHGYKNQELKKNNKIYQWLLYSALVADEAKSYNGTICGNTDTIENKLMISGISIIYFVRSFFLWDNITNSISLKKMNKVNSVTSILDTFQEFSFTLVVYFANIWVVFVEEDIQNMILNSLAMEFLMVLDNEFEELYFQYVPGSAEYIYDNIFVSYEENKILLEDRQQDDKCFRCFSYVIFVPYKLLVLALFLFPFFCFFMIFAGPTCK